MVRTLSATLKANPRKQGAGRHVGAADPDTLLRRESLTYILTWQPAICDAGEYFVTVLKTDGHELTLEQIIEAAHDIEELEQLPGYYVGSVISIPDGTDFKILGQDIDGGTATC